MFTLTSVTAVSGGTAELDANNDVLFTPDANFSGAATFTYTIEDLFGATDTATVTVDVAAIVDAPVVTIASGGDGTPQPATGPVLVDDDAAGNNSNSTKSTVLNNGNVVVATYDQPDDASETRDWFVNVFDSSGALIVRHDLGLMDSWPPRSDGRQPVSLAATETGFIAVWNTEFGSQTASNGIMKQMFANDGTPTSAAEFLVTPSSPGVDPNSESELRICALC